MRTFVLWDIDGTLVSAGRIGEELYDEAFRVVFGRDPDEPIARTISMGGRTDHDITLELLARHGMEDGHSHLPAFSSALVDVLAAKIDVLRERGRALPGAKAALEAMGEEPGVVQSLLTGNIEPNAAVKLAAFGLDGHVDLEVGGYGSDDHRRPFLVDVARRKAKAKYGRDFGPSDTVLVGDTPLDIAAGREGGARVVAVATGAYTREQLTEAGADAVLDDLTGTRHALDVILDR
jgi:phosphoglycolate phosphatase-like HAD superfamily hydrolase